MKIRRSLLSKNFKRTLNDDDKDIQQITDSYSEIIRLHPSADTSGEIRAKIKDINSRWEILNGTVNETLKNVREKPPLTFEWFF